MARSGSGGVSGASASRRSGKHHGGGGIIGRKSINGGINGGTSISASGVMAMAAAMA